ncbi:MAG: hypothetical protein AAF944_00480 [Bacteroidota bacterium]
MSAYDNIHVSTSVSRSVTPHWRVMSMYLFQFPGTDAYFFYKRQDV